MAPAGGKVSPTASNAPVSVRAHLFLDRQDASTTEPPTASHVPVSARAPYLHSAGGSTTSGALLGARTWAQGVFATLGMIRV